MDTIRYQVDLYSCAWRYFLELVSVSFRPQWYAKPSPGIAGCTDLPTVYLRKEKLSGSPLVKKYLGSHLFLSYTVAGAVRHCVTKEVLLCMRGRLLCI